MNYIEKSLVSRARLTIMNPILVQLNSRIVDA